MLVKFAPTSRAPIMENIYAEIEPGITWQFHEESSFATHLSCVCMHRLIAAKLRLLSSGCDACGHRNGFLQYSLIVVFIVASGLRGIKTFTMFSDNCQHVENHMDNSRWWGRTRRGQIWKKLRYFIRWWRFSSKVSSWTINQCGS